MRGNAQRISRSEDIYHLRDVDALLLERLALHEQDADFWSSKDRDRTDSAHCIFQYPAMMVPLVQRRLLQTMLAAQPETRTIYDPFLGSGTSLVSGMHYGLGVFGNDVNPLAILISRVRTAPRVDGMIQAICQNVARNAAEDGRTTIETSLSNRDKWFQPEVAVELSRLRRAIRRCDSLWVRRFLWTTLAETVRLTSNDRTSTYKLHARPSEEIRRRQLSPLKVFADVAVQNAESFATFRRKLKEADVIKGGRYQARTDVRLADSRGELGVCWTEAAPFDLVMTSPPYGDNLTTVPYGQHSYLPLNWIDFSDIDSDVDICTLRTTHEIDRCSLGGRALPGREHDDEELLSASPTLKRLVEEMPLTSRDGRARLTRFYTDFRDSLRKVIDLLRPNGYMIWTVGNRNIASKQVRTDLILGDLLEEGGCKVLTTLTRHIHHKRMPDRNASSATMREEKILLVRKLPA